MLDGTVDVVSEGEKRGASLGGKRVVTELNSAFLTPEPPASSVYVHVLEATSPLKRPISVTSPFHSPWIVAHPGAPRKVAS